MGKSSLFFLTTFLVLLILNYLIMLHVNLAPSLQTLLLAINAASFWYMGIDKRQACVSGARAPERLTYIIAALGGSIGVLMGCIIFRHKIRKGLFMLLLFCIGICQLFFVRLLAEAIR